MVKTCRHNLTRVKRVQSLIVFVFGNLEILLVSFNLLSAPAGKFPPPEKAHQRKDISGHTTNYQKAQMYRGFDYTIRNIILV